ncbi:uncharacterized protein RAG0_13897 [Rhynchosporium agropyri]|uniref:MalT-like TPR region domain-containing protein n=1 Tax=Rhynchosporium agropyri TaxID=914238 RepID=A0A1E1LEN3_9HELO|nr:uncharacterized protein RAG0_13897 [Rhynchosporium agropyri]
MVRMTFTLPLLTCLYAIRMFHEQEHASEFDSKTVLISKKSLNEHSELGTLISCYRSNYCLENQRTDEASQRGGDHGLGHREDYNNTICQIPPVLAIFGDLWDNSGPKLPLQNTSKALGYLNYMTGDLAAAAHILESSRLTCDEQTDAHFILHTNALFAQVKMLQEKTDEAILLPRRALRYMEFSPFTAEKEWMTTAQNLGIMLIQQSLSDDDGTKLDMLAEAIQVLTKLLDKSAACSPEITSTQQSANITLHESTLYKSVWRRLGKCCQKALC